MRNFIGILYIQKESEFYKGGSLITIYLDAELNQIAATKIYSADQNTFI